MPIECRRLEVLIHDDGRGDAARCAAAVCGREPGELPAERGERLRRAGEPTAATATAGERRDPGADRRRARATEVATATATAATASALAEEPVLQKPGENVPRPSLDLPAQPPGERPDPVPDSVDDRLADRLRLLADRREEVTARRLVLR